MRREIDGRCRSRRSFIGAAAAVGIAGGMAGCTEGGLMGNGGDGPAAPVRAIAKGYRDDDVDAVREATHPESPLLESLRESEVTEVDVEVVSAEVVRQSGGRAVVHAELDLSGGSNAPQGVVDFTAETRTHEGTWLLWQLRQGRPTPTRTPGATEEPTEEPTETPRETEEPTDSEERTPTSDALFYEGFEAGVDRWDVHEDAWGRTNQAAFDGEYSAGIATRGRMSALASVDLGSGERVGSVSYYWAETSNSFGGGLRLFNGDDALEMGTTSDNPQWVVDDADGIGTVASGGDYGNWIRTELRFDWNDGVVTVEFRDTATGASYSGVHPLKEGRDVRRIELTAFTSEQGWASDSCRMFWDELVVED